MRAAFYVANVWWHICSRTSALMPHVLMPMPGCFYAACYICTLTAASW